MWDNCYSDGEQWDVEEWGGAVLGAYYTQGYITWVVSKRCQDQNVELDSYFDAKIVQVPNLFFAVAKRQRSGTLAYWHMYAAGKLRI